MVAKLVLKKIALVNVYPLVSGVGNVAISYFQTLNRVLGPMDKIRFYQLAERKIGTDARFPMEVISGLKGLPRQFSVPFNRILLFPRKMEALNEDVLMLTDPTISYHKTSSAKKRIVLVHDLRPFTEYEKMKGEKLFYKLIWNRFSTCDYYIASSNATKQELVDLNFESERISVVHPPARTGRISFEKVRSLVRKDTKHITFTYVANDLPYKNITFYLQLCSMIQSKIADQKPKFLLISSMLSHKTSSLLEKLNLRNFEHRSRVKEIAEIYRETDVLLFPSLYEGYGLPVAEAMSYGIPVIANDLGVMRELIGKNDLLCQPSSIQDWMNKILRLLEEKNYHNASEFLLERSRQFSPEEFERNLESLLTHISF